MTPAQSKLDSQPSQAAVTFAPVPTGHPLASIWNDPDFYRRLMGSYGFASNIEPPVNAHEQAAYREKIVPLLRENAKKAIPALQSLAKPTASALFDFSLGNAFFQTDDLTNAIQHFQAAVAKFPDYRRAHQNLAFALLRNGQIKQAIHPLLRTIALGGGDSKVFGLLGFAYMDQGRFVSAEGAYRQALVFEPNNEPFRLGLIKCAMATANYDYALALLDELLRHLPERGNLWTLRANLLLQKEQPAQAAVSLEMLRRLGQAQSQDLFLLGDLYMARDAADLALDCYLDALDADPNQNLAAALRPAQILISRGAWDQAKTLLAKIRQNNQTLGGPDQIKWLKLESKIAAATGESDKSIQILEEILRKDPLDGEALLLAGDFYSAHAQPEKAEIQYDAAAQLRGFEAEALVKKAQLLVQSRKYLPALESLKRAQKIKSRDNVQRYLEKVEQLALTRNS